MAHAATREATTPDVGNKDDDHNKRPPTPSRQDAQARNTTTPPLPGGRPQKAGHHTASNFPFLQSACRYVVQKYSGSVCRLVVDGHSDSMYTYRRAARKVFLGAPNARQIGQIWAKKPRCASIEGARLGKAGGIVQCRAYGHAARRGAWRLRYAASSIERPWLCPNAYR